ncbi:MAG: hypothetical protein AAF670_11560 [Planctomycetota bacterium]
MRLFSTIVLVLHLAAIADRSVAQTQPDPIEIEPLHSGAEASFRGLAVRNHREAWIAGSGGTVIRTTDSGKTWQRVRIPGADEFDFRDVELLRDGTVLLMSVGEGGASRLFRSRDSGNKWRTVLVNPEPHGFFDGMTFRGDRLHGALYGDPVNGRLEIYRTSDGGATWTQLPMEHRPKLEEGEYGFAASGTGILARGRELWIATGGSVARVWRSNNDGTTWQPYDAKIRCGSETSGIFSLDFIDHRSAIAVGGDYAEPELDRDNVATSSDGGKTWSAVPDVSMPHKACVQSLGGGRILACGRTGVAFSNDSGRTWKTISRDGYYTLRADPSTGIGFLAGSDGRIARFTLTLSD